MATTPGPDFRWGVLLRRSKFNRQMTPEGEVLVFEESTDRQEMEVVWHIKNNNMGVIVDTYKDIASGWKPGAPRPRFKHALVDLASGRIDGIAVLNIDRLTRSMDQVRSVLSALEEMGGRLFSLEDELDTADDDPGSNTEFRLYQLVERAERETRRTSERSKLAAKHRARKGLPQRSSDPTRSPHMRPLGHSADWSSLVPQEAELLNEAALRVAAGEALNAICRDFTRRRIPTARGKALWRPTNLRATLLSPRMIGKREHDGTLIDLPDVPPILPENLWRKVCEKLMPHTRRARRRESRQASNIALCGICGLAVIGDTFKGTSIYGCRKRPAAPEA
jgi:site-specific DNA recombinase